MPKTDWEVVLVDAEGEPRDYAVQACTEDGAMNRAADEFRREFGRLPHADQFKKVSGA